jgi:hypothetical protein
MGNMITPVFLLYDPSRAFSGFDAGPYGPSACAVKYLMGRHQGLIPSGATARGGSGTVAVGSGVAVLVGAAVAVGGAGVGDGNGVLVGGMAVGVAVGGDRKGIPEQPEKLTSKLIKTTEKTRFFIVLFFNIITTLSIDCVLIITSTK